MKTLQEIIEESENIVFFGGAGVSTASGILIFVVVRAFIISIHTGQK